MPKLVEKDTNVPASEKNVITGSDSDEDEDEEKAGFVSASQYDPGPVCSLFVS